MAKVQIKALWPGTKHGVRGPVTVTREKCRYYQRQLDDFKRAGISVPVVWGHQLSAMPVEAGSADAKAYAAARYNAGYLDGSAIDPTDGGLVLTVDAPGLRYEGGKLVGTATLPDGTPVTTAIKEVSPLFGGPWKDGAGKVWNDVLGHLALTPYPAQVGQAGFTALAAPAPGAMPAGFHYFAAEVPDKKKPGETDDADPADDVADDLVDAAAEEPDEGEELPVDADAAAGQADVMSRVLANAAAMGVTLPPDTTPENFLERFDIASTALLANKALADAQPKPGEQAPPRTQVREEPAPGGGSTMLSTFPPAAQKIIRQEATRLRGERVKRIGELEKRGLPVHVGNRLRAAAAATKLSLTKDGDLKPADIDARLDLLAETLPAADDPRQMLSTARPVPNPATRPDDGEMVVHPASGIEMPKSQLARVQEQAKR